jgi:hypothetical protein
MIDILMLQIPRTSRLSPGLALAALAFALRTATWLSGILMVGGALDWFHHQNSDLGGSINGGTPNGWFIRENMGKSY